MSASEESFIVDLQPIGRRVSTRSGKTLLQAAQSGGIELQAICGGTGTCGRCQVRLVAGQLSPATAEESQHFTADSLVAGWRLACQVSVRSDVTVEIPAESLTSGQRVQLESEESRVEVDGAMAGAFGLAVDLGTTKLAGYLVNLGTGETIAQRGLMNPQIAYGEDVISRISYASTSEECRQRLAECARHGVNQLAESLCEKAGVPQARILRAVIAGNTAMHHLFLGLPVEQLGRAPYLPASTLAAQLSARQIGLTLCDETMVYTPPNIAGYMGGDHVAMLMGINIQACESPTLAIDIGTNTELTLKVDDRLLACSCASGPAFEGAHIHQGMRAAPGAIERVMLHEGMTQFYTIDRLPARGICGSGILDAIAVLLDSEVLDPRGNFRCGKGGVRVRNGMPEFVLADAQVAANGAEVTVSRQDVCELQLAKAAIRAGIDVLLEAGSVEATALEKFFIAGAFGSYLDPLSAMRIGLFPAMPLERIRQVGNAAGLGARQMLASATKRSEAERLASRIEYIELTNHPAFHKRFVRAMLF
jgi:uncharacterized 2Fe-2S/4Fe-4S cluster protein (DUF4445 family)